MHVRRSGTFVPASSLLLIFALTACETPPTEPGPADPPPALEAAPPPEPPPPRVLTLLAVPDPQRYAVVDEAHPARYFGSVGRLLADADAGSKTDAFTAAARQRKLQLGAELTTVLEHALQRDGWVVHRVPVARDRPDALIANSAAYAGDGEAVLDVAIGSAGYAAAAIADPYGPCVTVAARLTRAGTPAEVIYAEQISAGSCAFPGYAALPAPAGFRYDSYDALSSHAEEAVDGLRRAAAAVARRIGPEVARALP